jgi:putative membrane-bound dehydrogenase-like protein
MKRILPCLALLSAFLLPHSSSAEDPIRVFIRAGKKSHGPGAHDFPKFLEEWKPMLEARGAQCDGGLEFPTAEQLDNTDVLILHAQEDGNISVGEERKNLLKFLKRGGGLVVIHAAAVSRDPSWYKTIIGGSWNFDRPTKWLEAPMSLYFTDRYNPITRDISNFDLEDEIYYDLDMMPDVHVLAAAYTPNAIDTGGRGNKEAQARAAEYVAKKKGVNIYDIQPQIWTYENTVDGADTDYRAFVHIPGHWHRNFAHNGIRTLLLRGIAWAAKRDNVDQLCKPEELGDALRYVEGGVPRPENLPSHLEVHPEFDISLVASEPLINNPMNIDWDEKGRLWVVETPEYPNGLRQANVESWMDSGSLMPGVYDREPQDRISILADTNGDGVMDEKTVFADRIELATSFVLHKNGVIVCAAPDIWWFEDTDGDDKADARTKLYTNLGTRDTHAVINNMRWGMDGWVYATHGYSSTDNVTSGDGGRDFGPINSGVVRFKPDGSAFEQYASRGGNTWGLEMTTNGEVFYTQPTTGNPLVHVALPEYILAKGKLPGVVGTHGLLDGASTHPAMHWEQQAYVQIDQVGRYTAGAGCVIYEGGAWPDKWNHSYFTSEPTLNIIGQFFVKPDGVSYSATKEAGREETEFIRSRNLWFRPIEVRTGPDGALYIVDFCNQAVIHNDTRGPTHGPANAAVRPDRDHYYGRIWRVQHKQAKPIKVPSLDGADVAALKKAAKSPNSHTRELAIRLLRERHDLDGPAVGSAAVRAYEKAARQTDPAGIVAAAAESTDDWTTSALIAASVGSAEAVVQASLKGDSTPTLTAFVAALTPIALNNGGAATAENLIRACADAITADDGLKTRILAAIATASPDELALSNETETALEALLARGGTSGAALAIVSRWEGSGALSKAVASLTEKLQSDLQDKSAPTEKRVEAARALLTVGGSYLKAGLAPLSDADAPKALQVSIVEAADENGHAAKLVPMFAKLAPVVQQAAFDTIIKRPEATDTLLKAVKSGAVDRSSFSPGNVSRLRSHPSRPLAKRATTLFAVDTSAKDAIITKLSAAVEEAGDAEKGKTYFMAACAVCHKLGDTGIAVGPALDGMGAHGAAELLVHIIDPNREVEPSFHAHNITTKKGEILQGVLTGENTAMVSLATQTGPREIMKSDIAKRENTRRSLMPEGFEALGAEPLRDLLTFIVGDANREFRIIDLSDATTADTRLGMFANESPKGGRLNLPKFGNLSLHGVPFYVPDPAKTMTGTNVVVLKGGPAPKNYSRTLPQSVEAQVGVSAKRLHLLSGVGAWAFPLGGGEGIPALKVTLHFTDGTKEEHEFKNGVEFADYIRRTDVPGSSYVPELSDRTQVRWMTLDVKHSGVIEKLVLRSFANKIAPVVVAITADIQGKVARPDQPPASSANPRGSKAGPKKGQAKAKAKKKGPKEPPPIPASPVNWENGKTKVLLIGGGSSHNFGEFFGKDDSATLKAAGMSPHYTEDRGQATQLLAEADVAVISVNRSFFDTPAYRKALMDRVAAGKGVIMLHPGTWYGYKDWPELNAKIVGGGSRGHDKLGPFQVLVNAKDHPIMAGVPDRFDVVDELYYMNAEGTPDGTAAITVLAETSPSQKYDRPHPSVWVTENDKARLVGIALGHDDDVHGHPAFQTILTNAVKWVAGM